MIDQITLFDLGVIEKAWKYDEDNGNVMCRCPDCGGRMLIGFYSYWNPYHFCPYCGSKLTEGEFVRKCCMVYGQDAEMYEKVRKEYGK